MGHQVMEPAAIEAEIDQLRSFALDALRRRWQVVFGRRPAIALSKDLLRRMIACRTQELAFGGLDRDSLRFLESLARQESDPPRRHLKAGTTLVRDYKGQRHTITVERDGYDWQGRTYRSLSAIARAITGTAWSGPRFFGLLRLGGGAKAKSAAGPRHRRHGRKKDEGRNGRQSPTKVNPPILQCETASHL